MAAVTLRERKSVSGTDRSVGQEGPPTAASAEGSRQEADRKTK
jgi:hypothetical protein